MNLREFLAIFTAAMAVGIVVSTTIWVEEKRRADEALAAMSSDSGQFTEVELTEREASTLSAARLMHTKSPCKSYPVCAYASVEGQCALYRYKSLHDILVKFYKYETLPEIKAAVESLKPYSECCPCFSTSIETGTSSIEFCKRHDPSTYDAIIATCACGHDCAGIAKQTLADAYLVNSCALHYDFGFDVAALLRCIECLTPYAQHGSCYEQLIATCLHTIEKLKQDK